MVRRQQAADRAIRPSMRSPGAPALRREVQRLFWIEIAKGLLPEKTYHRRRRQDALGRLTPIEYEMIMNQTVALAA